MIRLRRVILRVTDMEQALTFWGVAVGLPAVVTSDDFSFLEAGGSQLVLHHVAEPPPPNLNEVVLESEDVVTDHAAMLGRGVPFEVDLRPVMSEGGQDLYAAHFRDPDGNLASLTGWVKP